MKFSKQQIITYFKSIPEMIQVMMANFNSSYLTSLLISFLLYQKEKRKQISAAFRVKEAEQKLRV